MHIHKHVKVVFFHCGKSKHPTIRCKHKRQSSRTNKKEPKKGQQTKIDA